MARIISRQRMTAREIKEVGDRNRKYHLTFQGLTPLFLAHAFAKSNFKFREGEVVKIQRKAGAL